MTELNNEIKAYIEECLESIVGDTPISVQLSAALKDHAHEDYISRSEYEALLSEVRQLRNLIGEQPVSEQIHMAMNK